MQKSASQCAGCARAIPAPTGVRWTASAPIPAAFVEELTRAGFLAALIPHAYGGSGLPLGAAAAILEEIQAAGCNGASCHAQMYVMGTLLRHGSEEQKQRYLPGIASGALRLQAFAVTEPGSGTDTASITTTARREGGRYIIRGRKIWTSRAEHSDLMILLARTSAVRGGHEAHGGALCVPGRSGGCAAEWPQHRPDPHHDEPCDDEHRL